MSGGTVLRQYLRGHVLLFALVQTALQGFSRKSLEIVRLSVENRLLGKLRRKYRRHIAAFRENFRPQPAEQSRKVWVCWFQGMENAPPLVQRCFRSLQENLTDREIVVITEENYREYVSFPDWLQEKIDLGVISRTHVSDLLRLELLIQYGGTWIDATVLCTGKNIPAYMLDAELFLFQTLKPGLDGHATAISNWFITARAHDPLLCLTRSLLHEYWAGHDKLVDYFIFHHFFQLAIENYPEQWDKVVPFSNSTPHILLLRLFEPCDDQTWQAIREMTPFHKLSYKFEQEKTEREGTYYRRVMETV